MDAVLKLRCQGETRRMILEGALSYARIRQAVHSIWPELAGAQARYTDDEGDSCTLIETTMDDFLAVSSGVTMGRRLLKLELDATSAAALKAVPNPAPEAAQAVAQPVAEEASGCRDRDPWRRHTQPVPRETSGPSSAPEVRADEGRLRGWEVQRAWAQPEVQTAVWAQQIEAWRLEAEREFRGGAVRDIEQLGERLEDLTLQLERKLGGAWEQAAAVARAGLPRDTARRAKEQAKTASRKAEQKVKEGLKVLSWGLRGPEARACAEPRASASSGSGASSSRRAARAPPQAGAGQDAEGTPASPPGPGPDDYAPQLRLLADMGFRGGGERAMLEESGGDVQRVIHRLLA